MRFTDLSTISTGTITQWGWDFNNDGIYTDATIQNPKHVFTAGSYIINLQVTSNTGCSTQISQTIYINYLPNPSFVGDVLIGCPIHPVNFSESSSVTPPANIVNWNWNFGNGNTSTSSSPGTILYNNTSSFASAFFSVNLTVTTDSGCVGSMTKNNYIAVYPLPIVSCYASPDTINPNNTVSVLHSSANGVPSNMSYTWTPAYGLSSQCCPLTSANPTVTTCYTVTVTDTNGCKNSCQLCLYVDPTLNVSGHRNSINSNPIIYPNPTSDQFYIETNSMDKLNVDLYDVNGRCVFSASVSDKSNIDVGTLDNSVYSLTIKTVNGIINKKLVIIH